MAILIFITLLSFSATIYLLYVRLSKKKLEAIKKKHPKDSKNFELYKVIYSTQTLVLSAFFSLMLIIRLLVNVYESLSPEATILSSSVILLLTLLPIALLFYWTRISKNSK